MFIDKKIRELQRRLGVERIIPLDIKGDGYYIGAISTIVYSSRLSEKDARRVILHELGHAAYRNEDTYLYNATPASRSKCERQANEYAIRFEFNEYVEKYGIENFNVFSFLESIGFSNNYDEYVKKLINEKYEGITQ